MLVLCRLRMNNQENRMIRERNHNNMLMEFLNETGSYGSQFLGNTIVMV